MRSRHATTGTFEDNYTGSPTTPFTEQRMATSRPMKGSSAKPAFKDELAVCQQAVQPGASQHKHQATARSNAAARQRISPKLDAPLKRELWRPGKPRVPKQKRLETSGKCVTRDKTALSQHQAKADASTKALMDASPKMQADVPCKHKAHGARSQHLGKRVVAKPATQPEAVGNSLIEGKQACCHDSRRQCGSYP